ncbi:MAG: RNase adapter RapZ, partial [Bacteroidota bacterium]
MINKPVRISEVADQPEVIQGNSVTKPFHTGDSTKPVTLTVHITSFSFLRGLPVDLGGNGGGFIFDCRALPNPGRYDVYRQATGKDEAVIGFLKAEPPMDEFLSNVYALVDQSVARYLHRNFTHLMVSFGCTGGQHRSVYCAEALSRHLKDRFPVNIIISHREMEK